MAAKKDSPCSKRDLRWTEEGCEVTQRYNLRKRLKVSTNDLLLGNFAFISARIFPSTETRYNGKEKADSANAKQDELRKFNGESEKKIIFNCEHQESESSEEEEGISIEEVKKTEGWKLILEGLDSKKELIKI